MLDHIIFNEWPESQDRASDILEQEFVQQVQKKKSQIKLFSTEIVRL